MSEHGERSTDEELLGLAHAIADPDHPVKRDMATWAAANLADRFLVGVQGGELVWVDAKADGVEIEPIQWQRGLTALGRV